MFNDIDSQETKAIASRLTKEDRFENYREITARFDSTGKCGHSIKKGDTIGWNKRFGVYCSSCWSNWSAENHEADMVERGFMPCVW